MLLGLGLLASSWLADALVPITGLEWNGGTVPPVRRDINELARQGGPSLDLFLLALKELQTREEDDEWGYFQIAGIHGYPAVTYDGVPLASVEEPGYCTHYSGKFPTWHRIYMTLFETSLIKSAQEISVMYPAGKKDEYMQAAEVLRLPYWDWLDHAELPYLATREQVWVNTPQGWQEIDNPLFTYKFHAGDGQKNGFPKDMKESLLPETVRKPGGDGKSNHTAANSALRSRAPLLLSVAYRCLMYTSIYDDFARMPQPVDDFDSNIEVLHNAVHNAAGGKGSHLSTTEFAAFDPIFWLHHANLDRVFAFWQTLNPGPDREMMRYSNGTGGGSFQYSGTSLDTEELPPFHRPDGSMWTSRQAWEWESLGYTYSEVVNRSRDSYDEYSGRTLRTLLREKYWSKAYRE